jgi:hypothetical protein
MADLRVPVRTNRQLSQGNDPINAQAYATQNHASPEDLFQPIYDRVNYAAGGTNQLSLFSQPQGAFVTLNVGGAAAVKNKSYRDTNMETAGVIATKRFTIIGMAINYIPAQQAIANALTPRIGDDIMILKNGGYCEFRIGDKPLLYMPSNLIPESNPIAAIASTANNVTIMGTGAAGAIPYPMMKFAIPVTINPQETFKFTMTFDGSPAISQATDIQVVFFAFMRRPS